MYSSIKCLFSLSDQHNYIDLVYWVYFTLLHVSAVEMNHQQVGHGYTKKGKGERPLLTNSTYKVVTK
jgi:hypothetical protein